MKNRKLLFYASLIIMALASCQSKNFDGFIIEGKTNNKYDGKVLILSDQYTNLIIDSTTIRNNVFELKGKLKSEPAELTLRINDSEQVTALWLENSKMFLDASKVDLARAQLIGSKTHEFAYKHLFSKLDSIEINTVDPYLALNLHREECIAFVEKHPDHIISAAILDVYDASLHIPIEKLRHLYNTLSQENKNSEYGKRVDKSLSLKEKLDLDRIIPQVSDSYIDFSMQDTSEIEQKLSDHLDKLTLLEFWASNCGPCLSELPIIKSEFEEYRSHGFSVVGVSLDNNEISWKKTINKYDLQWTNLSDLNGHNSLSAIQYGVGGIPDNFLIDSSGVIVARGLKGKQLSEAIKKHLGQ